MVRIKHGNPQRNYVPPPLRRTRLTLLKNIVKLFGELGIIANLLKRQRKSYSSIRRQITLSSTGNTAHYFTYQPPSSYDTTHQKVLEKDKTI